MKPKPNERGKLKIGDDWNAIRIIALSQSNPLKAIAEFVENGIDAKAATITITRGREHGEHYLSDQGRRRRRSPRRGGAAKFQVRRDAHLRFDQAAAESGRERSRPPGRVRHRAASELRDRIRNA